mgnify:CR=1 FL=1
MSSSLTFPFPYTNAGGEGGSVVIIRHGERMDEVAGLAEQWEAACRQDHSHCRETFYSRVNDPPLTEDGKLQAREVANTLKQELLKSPEMPQVIFSSKLIRSLMTAYEIAKELSLPICVSRGFALTAAAVVKKGSKFSFLTLEQMRELCPGVELIDGDLDIFHPPHLQPSQGADNSNTSTMATISVRPRSLSDERLDHIPDRSWEEALRFLGNWKYSLVVAHRESIRNLSGQYLKTPYCCYGIFSFHMRSYGVRDGLAPQIDFLAERNGAPLAFKKVMIADVGSDDDEEVVDF